MVRDGLYLFRFFLDNRTRAKERHDRTKVKIYYNTTRSLCLRIHYVLQLLYYSFFFFFFFCFTFVRITKRSGIRVEMFSKIRVSMVFLYYIIDTKSREYFASRVSRSYIGGELALYNPYATTINYYKWKNDSERSSFKRVLINLNNFKQLKVLVFFFICI